MGRTRLWAAKDENGFSNLLKGDAEPKIRSGEYIHSKGCVLLATRTDIAALACISVANGQCREIKSIDLINWTVEYVPNPPTLKEAWEEYRMLNRQSLSCCGTARDLFDALQREFPDE